MAEYKVNEQCIIGLPSCGYGFASARMCFIARPSDGAFQFEEDILTQLLKERNYETYVALQNVDPGKLAFCTKICSRIITSHFCIVLLNPSAHAEQPQIKIPNPNVYLEYGMMLSFRKHVIPMLREEEQLPFNVQPLDSVKYTPATFKSKAEEAIDDAIQRFITKEPPGRPIGAASEVLTYFGILGMRFSDTTSADTAAVYRLGSSQGFHLFDGLDSVVFFGYFSEEDPRQIVTLVRILINNINLAFNRVQQGSEGAEKKEALAILNQIKVTVLAPEDAPIEEMKEFVDQYSAAKTRAIQVEFMRPSELSAIVTAEHDKIPF